MPSFPIIPPKNISSDEEPEEKFNMYENTCNTRNIQTKLQFHKPPLQRPKTFFTRRRDIGSNSTTTKKRKRKKKLAKKNQACLYCGTVETPEWRKGPCGTLSFVSNNITV